jgi:putative Mg2+ transporter-C (MgtC) family protein
VTWTLPLSALTDVVGEADYASVVRILVAAALGGVIGWERERHGRAAGLRTHLVLCVGCALFMLVSLRLPTLFARYTSGSVMRSDPGGIAAHVVSGVGFLGAGAILVLGQKIRGLTTAATIWVTAAIGLAVGSGYLFAAVFAAAVVMVALEVLGRWEARMHAKDRYVQLAMHFAQPGSHIKTIRELLQAHSLELLEYTVDWSAGAVTYNTQLRYSAPVNFEETTTDLTAKLSPLGLSKAEWT